MARQVKCCLFDMDGLLLDTESLYTVAQQKILDRFGLQFTWDLKAQMMGKRALDAAQVLIDTLKLGDQLTPEGFVQEREEILDVLFATSPLMPGVDRLIRHLVAHRIPIAVATSSHRRHFDLKTSSHKDLFSLFNYIITADDVEHAKPHPQIFQVAASKIQADVGPLQPTECLVFEDAPSGVTSALAASMWCVMVPDPKLDTELTKTAHQVLNSLEQFKPEDWGLPAFE